MASRMFNIDGRSYADYELSNEQIVSLVDGDALGSEDKKYLMEKAYQRFKYECCAKNGESLDDVFVRQFSDFVNGKCHSKEKVAEKMCREHRYLQNEMFKVCLEYIKKLSENCEKEWFDGRNKYACETSKKIIDYFKEIDYPY